MLILADKPLHKVVDQLETELESKPLFFGHSTSSAWEEACWMALYATEQDMEAEVFDWDSVPTTKQLAHIQALLCERINSQRPLAYIIHEAWFCGLRFYVDERVIVPRSYFGEWIPQQFSPWIQADKVHRALDLCTGSGCVAIALAYAFPKASIDATELSQTALEVAKINVDQHQLQSRVKLHLGDLFAGMSGRYDLICANPPYICNKRMENLPAEYLHEPDLAFRGGDLGLDLVDKILAQAASYLHENGSLIVEVGTSALALEDKYPYLEFTWLSTDDEAMALFMLQKDQLLDIQANTLGLVSKLGPGPDQN